jgi:hypothetical protein
MSFYDPPRAYDSRFDPFARQQRTPVHRSNNNTTSVYLRPSAATPALHQSNNARSINTNYNNVESRYMNHFPKATPAAAAAAKITTTTTTRTTTISKPSASNTPIVRSETFTKVDHQPSSKPVGRSDTFTVKNHPKPERVKVKKVVTMNPVPDHHSNYSTFTKKKGKI